METIFAQIMADQWKVTPDDVVLGLADTATIAMGFGTIASRSTVTLSAAILYASAKLRDKVFSIAANMLECAPADLELRDGGVGIVGVPGQTVTLAKIAAAARPGWDNSRPAGVDAGLEETHYWEPPTVTWSYAVHVAIVEVDRELGRVTVEKYAVAHDCGTVVNPLLLDGQVAGGTAQGLGGILMEELVYDENGQLLTGSLMDYLVPTASDMPDIAMVHLRRPRRSTRSGSKASAKAVPSPRRRRSRTPSAMRSPPMASRSTAPRSSPKRLSPRSRPDGSGDNKARRRACEAAPPRLI